MKRTSTKASAIVIVILFGIVFASAQHIVHAQSLPVIGVWSSHYNSANITDTSLVAGQKFAVQVNITGAPFTGWNGYEFVLYYDQQYINVTKADYTTNTIFPNPSPSPGFPYNGPGALRASIVNLGPVFADSGLLMNITFQVVKAGGVSPLVLAAGMAVPGVGAGPPVAMCPSCPAGAPNWSRIVAGSQNIAVDTADGYFKNEITSQGPVASFTFTPPAPQQGDTITFNATGSFDPDNNNPSTHGIATYSWDFGDTSSQSNLTSVSPVVTHAFAHGGTGGVTFSGNFSIRLIVRDSDDSFSGMQVQLLTISVPATHCVQVTGLFTKSQVFTGDPLNIQVQLTNSGSYPEEFNLTLEYGPPNATLAPITALTLAPTKIQSYPFTITTTNLPSAVYKITAIVTLYGFSNCAEGMFISQFAVVPPSTGNPGLVIGSAVAILAGIVVIGTILARRRKRPEPP